MAWDVTNLGQDPSQQEASSAAPGALLPVTPTLQDASPASATPFVPTPNPATGAQNPYQPLQLPPQGTPPAATLAANMPQQEDPRQLGAVTHGGAAGYLGNQLLRGFIQGRAAGQVQQAGQFMKQQQGLNLLYDNAASDYYRLAQSGADPSSPDMQNAQQRVQASWDSLMGFYGQHVPQPKGAAAKQPFPQRMMNALHSQDPNEVLPTIYEGMQKSGPPVFHQAQQYLTPQYRQQVATQQGTQQTLAQGANTAASTQVQTDQLIAEQRQLQALPNPTPQQQQRLVDLTNSLRGLPGEAKMVPPKYQLFRDPANANHIVSLDITREQPPDGFLPTSAAMFNRPPKEAWSWKNGKPFSMYVDPFSNQAIPGTENYAKSPPAAVEKLLNNIKTSTGTGVDANGNEFTFGKTSTSTMQGASGIISGIEAANTAGGGQPGGGQPGTQPGGQLGGQPTAPQPPGASPTGGAPAAAPAGGNELAPGTHTLAYTGSPAYKDLARQQSAFMKDYNNQASLKNYVFGVPGASTSILKRAMAGDSMAQYALLLNYLKGTVTGSGVRLTQQELSSAQKSTPWLASVQAQFTPDGYVPEGSVHLTPQQMTEMARDLMEKSKSMDQQKQNWTTQLQQQRDSDMAAGGFRSHGTAGNTYTHPQTGRFVVTDPHGGTHPFDTQQQADQFKKLAGIP